MADKLCMHEHRQELHAAHHLSMSLLHVLLECVSSVLSVACSSAKIKGMGGFCMECNWTLATLHDTHLSDILSVVRVYLQTQAINTRSVRTALSEVAECLGTRP